MATTAQRSRSFTGPALLSYGFRPFFLLGAAWAAVSLLVWLPILAGRLRFSTAFSPVEWHVHELLYGYVPAVVAGFLLTAVPNWTGRLPVVGTPLLGLVVLWGAGRVAVLLSAVVGAVPAAVIDVLFLAALAAVAAREVIAGRHWRSLRVLPPICVLIAGNVLFHVESMTGAATGYGARSGIAATITLIMLIGGRIIPSFTHNWLARRPPGRLPQTFGKFDGIAMVAAVVALGLWVVSPQSSATTIAAVVACGLHVVRLGRWAGERTGAEPLVLVLHVAYAFVPAGFALVALANVAPAHVMATGALHGWTTGAIGLMTLAVMTRASLGHTGRPLTATRAISLIYASVLVSALARIAAAVGVSREPMLHLSATAWVIAFAGFVVVYAPLLTKPRSAAG